MPFPPEAPLSGVRRVLRPGQVLHYRRTADGTITVAILRDGAIALDPPGLSLDVSDCLPAEPQPASAS